MARKRKTREEKIRASIRRQPKIQEKAVATSLDARDFSLPTYRFVNREFASKNPGTKSEFTRREKGQNSIQFELLASNKPDLLKTFLISSFILTLELVLYFALKS